MPIETEKAYGLVGVGSFAEAVEAYRQTWEIDRRFRPEHSHDVLSSLSNWGWALAPGRTTQFRTPNSGQPVLHSQTADAHELPQIVADQDQSRCSRVACDHLIVRPDGLAYAGQFRADLPGMDCRASILGQHLESGRELLDVAQIALDLLRTFGAEDQLHQRH